MKMDRHINADGCGKYALILLRRLMQYEGSGPFDGFAPNIQAALDELSKAGVLDFGMANTDGEFFLIRLKDRHAAAALSGYARSAEEHGETEWAEEVRTLATKAAMHPGKKRPD